MKLSRCLGLSVAALLLPVACLAQGHKPPKKTEIAPGIFLFATPAYSDVGLDGNSVVILSREGVLVFDANGTPAAAAAVLAEIRKMTDQPVRYVVLSHWHWDHWYGAEVYREAFPGVHIIAHEKTRELMMGPAIEFNRPGLEQGLPGHVKDVEGAVARAESQTPPPANLARLKQHVADDKFFLEQKRAVRFAFPDVSYKNALTIHLGEREIHVLNYGRAVTPGDSFLYLPKEKILVTGDLLINPIPFALFCYPTEWIAALEKMEKLDAATIVPGHGEPLADKELLRAYIVLLKELQRAGTEAKKTGVDVDEAKKAILESAAVKELRTKITKDDAQMNQYFAVYVVDWFLHRVYEELDAPLTDKIGVIPSK